MECKISAPHHVVLRNTAARTVDINNAAVQLEILLVLRNTAPIFVDINNTAVLLEILLLKRTVTEQCFT